MLFDIEETILWSSISSSLCVAFLLEGTLLPVIQMWERIPLLSQKWLKLISQCEKPVISSILTPLLEKKCSRYTVCLLIPIFLNCFYLNKCTNRGYNVKLHFIARIVQNPDQTVHPKNCYTYSHEVFERTKLQVLWDVKEIKNRVKVTGGQEKRDCRQFAEKEVHLNTAI